MFRLAFMQFIRSRSVIIALALFLLTGIVSIVIGKQFLVKQQAAVEAVTHLQQEQIERNVRYIPDQFGLLMYYLRFAYINGTDPVAALSIGQQDVNSAIQYLTIRGLEGQRYDTGLYNPYNQLIGNLDLSFVVLFLFPLLIIAFNFNVLSQEEEQGTWPLVKVQVPRPVVFILRKLGVRLLVVLGLLSILLVLAVVIIRIPLSARLLAWSLTAVLYVLFWFAVSFVVIALRKSSSISALMLLSAWVTLCLLIPAMVNNYLSVRYPVKEAFSTFIRQRDGYHNKWDKDADSTMEAFFRHYPQFREYTWNGPKFNYMWYYAMQHLGDDEAAPDSEAMRQKLRQRQASAITAAWFFPAMHAQVQFTSIAGTGLEKHLGFLDSTAAFHERQRLYFYPKIFGDSAVATEDWSRQVPQFYLSASPVEWGALTAPLLAFILVLGGCGWVVFERKSGR